MKTFADLKIGTVVAYNDAANVDQQSIILDTVKTPFGTYVRVMDRKTLDISLKSALCSLERYTIIANEIQDTY